MELAEFNVGFGPLFSKFTFSKFTSKNLAAMDWPSWGALVTVSPPPPATTTTTATVTATPTQQQHQQQQQPSRPPSPPSGRRPRPRPAAAASTADNRLHHPDRAPPPSVSATDTSREAREARRRSAPPSAAAATAATTTALPPLPPPPVGPTAASASTGFAPLIGSAVFDFPTLLAGAAESAFHAGSRAIAATAAAADAARPSVAAVTAAAASGGEPAIMRIRVATSAGTLLVPISEDATVARLLAEAHSRLFRFREDDDDDGSERRVFTAARSALGDVIDVSDAVGAVLRSGELLVGLTEDEAAYAPQTPHPVFAAIELRRAADPGRALPRPKPHPLPAHAF
ncbi:hypothetical protein HK405_012852, partial [Cladochytrium tenue]